MIHALWGGHDTSGLLLAQRRAICEDRTGSADGHGEVVGLKAAIHWPARNLTSNSRLLRFDATVFCSGMRGRGGRFYVRSFKVCTTTA